MEQTDSTSNPNAGKTLGIIGMILGIIAVIFSFIPCLGIYALYPGILGFVLSLISFVQANKAGAAKGMAIAGIVCSILGCIIAGYQLKKLSDFSNDLDKEMKKFDKELNSLELEQNNKTE